MDIFIARSYSRNYTVERTVEKIGPSSNDRSVSCLAPPLRSGANSLEAHHCPKRTRATRASLVPPRRSGTKLALAYGIASSHSAVLGVELEQPLKRRSYIQISQRIGVSGQPRRSSGR